MHGYRNTLRAGDFRRLLIGTTTSAIGDGMTFVALAWMVLAQPDSTTRLGLLGVAYTAPVLLGGLLVGPVLDRFDTRTVLITDSVIRAGAVGSLPLAAAAGGVPHWLPFAVALVYGLLKMVPLAGFPAAIPVLVDERDLDTANALESLSYGVASIVGPVTAGLLIGLIGAPAVLALDAVSFLVLAAAAARVRQPLRQVRDHDGPPVTLRGLRRDRAIVATTFAFMAFNVAEGMLLVTAPWLAKHTLPSGAGALGMLLAAAAAGELLGALAAGGVRMRSNPLRAIGAFQVLAASGFLLLLTAPSEPLVALGFFTVGVLSAPMTVWAQSMRMRRIPPHLRGRAFALLRTLMQATLPLGSAAVTPLLALGSIPAAVLAMTVLAGLPGVALLVLRDPAPPTTGGGHPPGAAERPRRPG